jgi:2-desacetyl-2-hydroxyethyl bacteriochlorophyllide A dehydrogenase
MQTMRAFVLTGARECGVQIVRAPQSAPGEVIVDIERVGVCGTDVEFYTGEMSYLASGQAHYPMRIGHEWMGTVSSVGDGVDPGWIGLRVTGDTMLGCGTCYRCRSGRHYVCEARFEIGVRNGWPGALAERLAVPASCLYALPDSVDDAAGAMVEPGGNALRAVRSAALSPGDRVLVLGTGSIGLLAAAFAHTVGAEVHVMGRSPQNLGFARAFGVDGAWTEHDLPSLPWDAVIDASNAAGLPARALELIEPARRVVYIGLAGSPSLIDTRVAVLKDVTAVGILGASAGLAGTIDHYAAGTVDPRPLVAATVGLQQVGDVLSGWRPASAGDAPKIHVDPRL